MKIGASLEEQIANKCLYFNGSITNKQCCAGITYSDIMQPGGKLPCFKDDNLPCPYASFLTPEEVQQEADRTKAAIAEGLKKLTNGICPHCDARIEEEKQVGRSVYALPCWHRLGQGKARKVIPQAQGEN